MNTTDHEPMRHRRLNGWQRIGIIASVIWIVVGGFYVRDSIIDESLMPMTWAMQDCERSWHANSTAPDAESRYDACIKTAEARPPSKSDERIMTETIMITFGLLALAWLLVYCLVWLARWIRRGFAG